MQYPADVLYNVYFFEQKIVLRMEERANKTYQN